eukprot:365693-Chlamydomonas_euryale.AAC.5
MQNPAGPLLRAVRRDKGKTQQRLLQVTAPVVTPVATVKREYFAISIRALLAEAGVTARISAHSARSLTHDSHHWPLEARRTANGSLRVRA